MSVSEKMRALREARTKPQRAQALTGIIDIVLENASPAAAPEVKAKTLPKELHMTWSELDRAGKMGAIKKNDYNLYAVLFRSEFGNYPKDFATKSDHNVISLYNAEYRKNRAAALSKMPWDDLYKAGKLAELKDLDVTAYREKFLQKFGVEPKY